jgi:hypothetical protein
VTLDEAIDHAERVARWSDSRRSKNHKQLAGWLKELRELRQKKDSPCLRCKYVSDDEKACCAGPILDIPWSEPKSFVGWDGKIVLPEKCEMVGELRETIGDLWYRLGETVKENGILERTYEELDMWVGWLISVDNASTEG